MQTEEIMGETLRETPVSDAPLIEIFNQFGVADDRTRAIIAYRIGARGNLTLAELGAHFGVTRERVRQIEKKFRETIGEENWAKLQGIYLPPKPLAATKKQILTQRAELRKHLKNMPSTETIQFGRIMDKLGIQFERISDAYAQDEIESCLTFYELYGIHDFGKYRMCTRCQNVLPTEENFYKVKGTDRYYSICKACNTVRCHEGVVRKRNEQLDEAE